MDFENVIVEKDNLLAVVTLNRPQQLNALLRSRQDLSLAMQALDRGRRSARDHRHRGEKVFAAGADIKEMVERGPFDQRITSGSPTAIKSTNLRR
jgi:enoyl-CoA hydratase/carnithine racemase